MGEQGARGVMLCYLWRATATARESLVAVSLCRGGAFITFVYCRDMASRAAGKEAHFFLLLLVEDKVLPSFLDYTNKKLNFSSPPHNNLFPPPFLPSLAGCFASSEVFVKLRE